MKSVPGALFYRLYRVYIFFFDGSLNRVSGKYHAGAYDGAHHFLFFADTLETAGPLNWEVAR